ncbi:hypothetical protein F5Y15DRAFT_48963 [Xylariaceae sp. FL0016]|nr:hypothetical protein F5Y15DRAFT_48963 [Xylariaceae sp. FL0016]
MDAKGEPCHLTRVSSRAASNPARGDKFKNTFLHSLAILGFVYLTNCLWRLGAALGRIRDVEAPELHDVYPDADYPLRPADEPWDISTSYEYTRNLSVTVNEGTWLRITTHPSKAEIVFDMLGDLYCMSSDDTAHEGAARIAHPILTGVPYEKEAEFSWDGNHLVFISDAGFGVDNIWTMPYTTCADMALRSQTEIRLSMIQQTNSTFRFFSSPAFHPTEPKIIATKWFLTGRPNGAGEIWEFPLQKIHPLSLPEVGGTRLVQRKLPASWPASRYQESQLGSEQARYTPYGDGIVFSRNLRDDESGKFTYNKDVHAGINGAFRMDLSTKQVTELVAAAPSAPNKPASPGGANMPRLSRDGRTLAFVRRSDDKEVLVLKDMRSGTVNYAWYGLSYDLSTIPAFMGAYPNYGWTANDSAIIIWSQGQIWSLPLRLNHLDERVAATSGPRKLSFQAHIDLKLGPTRYSESKIKDSELAQHHQARALRALRSNYAGDQVVFEAAGDNFIVQVSSGVTRPVPKPDDTVSCYSPSFTTSSHCILQACWDDRNFTSFYLADIDSGRVSVVYGLPRGRYISPVMGNDYISFVRTGKDYMFGDVEETFGEGIWIGRFDFREDRCESPSATALQMISGFESGPETKLELVTRQEKAVLLVKNPGAVAEFELDNGEKRSILSGKTAVEMTAYAAAGGQQTVAFRDFQHIWLSANLESSSVEVWSKPGDSKTPTNLLRLTEHGGHDVVFSGDGQKVFWLFGPTLRNVNVAQVDRMCSEASLKARDSGECAKPLVSSLDLNVTFATALGQQIAVTNSTPFAIINTTLISMDPAIPIHVPKASIVVQDGLIIAVGNAAEVTVPPNAAILDAHGGATLPGFVDVHGHWGGFLSPYPLQSWEMEAFLGYGVTTIHNPASKNVAGQVERSLIEKGRMYGPRAFHAGDVLYGSIQPPVYTEINSRADAHAALLRVKTEGGDAAFSVKNYQLVARSARQRLLLEAAELDMLVVPEGGWSFDWGLTYFIDGYTSHEHPLPVPELYEDVLSLVAASGSSITPLAVMNYGGIFGQHWIHQTVEVPRDQKLRQYVKHDILESLTEVKQAPKSSYMFFNTTRSTGKLAARGVRTNVGAHGEQPIGFLYHSEMKMMALGEQEPYSVLRHATIDGAISLGLNASIGSVEVGKLADLVIYPPGIETVGKVWDDSMHMKYVMRGGTVFDVEDGLVEFWPRQGRKQHRARLNPEDSQSCVF